VAITNIIQGNLNKIIYSYLEDLGLGHEDVSLVRLKLAASGTNKRVKLEHVEVNAYSTLT